MNERQNKRLNAYEKECINLVKKRLNEKLNESGMKKTELYIKTQDMGFSFSDKALYNAFNYSETSLNMLVVIAICKVLHINYSWLFSEPNNLESFSGYLKENISGADLYVPLTDAHYMHTYYCYTFQPTYNKLYRHCELSMEKTGDGKSIAVLKISYVYNRCGKKEDCTNVFTGTPILCKADDVVYIVFTSNIGYVQLLCFNYIQYRRADMYFRSGALILVNPITKTPQFQKIIMSSRELDVKELPYVEGLLRISGDSIIVTEDSMEQLLKDDLECKLMEQFRKDFMPFFQLLKHNCYIVNEREILSYSASRLSETQRLKAIMLLKRKSLQPCDVNVKVADALPRLVRLGLLEEEKNE